MLIALSIPAFWFIDMALFAPDEKWLNQLYPLYMDITIAKFEFPKNGQYSLTNLLSCLCQLKKAKSISLRELTLSYEYSGHNLDSPNPSNLACTMLSADIHFTSTSKDFIAHLYSIANVFSDEILIFEDCEIPNISHLQFAGTIYLENIPDDQGLSLRNILASWEGSELRIHSCPSFDDTLLSWLGSEGEYLDSEDNGIWLTQTMFPAKHLSSLHVHNCVNFTSPTLVDVIEFRKDAHTAFLVLDSDVITDRPLYISSIYSLSVHRGPALTLEAMNWFYATSNEEDSIGVSWHTEDDEGEVHVFSCGR
jgi:hypothetical protein